MKIPSGCLNNPFLGARESRERQPWSLRIFFVHLYYALSEIYGCGVHWEIDTGDQFIDTASQPVSQGRFTLEIAQIFSFKAPQAKAWFEPRRWDDC